MQLQLKEHFFSFGLTEGFGFTSRGDVGTRRFVYFRCSTRNKSDKMRV
jgi:hypothetical protein